MVVFNPSCFQYAANMLIKCSQGPLGGCRGNLLVYMSVGSRHPGACLEGRRCILE
jgi:hypothetical protein